VNCLAGGTADRHSGMSWPAALLALLVSHAVGDVLLQTDRQAEQKIGGLGQAVARRALARHVATYTLSFVPALVWVGRERTPARAAAVAGSIAIPHLVIDHGRLVGVWLRDVKGSREPAPGLVIAVDQSFHLLCLFGTALVAAA
jgi:hypothetical protein